MANSTLERIKGRHLQNLEGCLSVLLGDYHSQEICFKSVFFLFYRSNNYQPTMLQKGKESITCSRLSDSEKDARVKDTRKYERVRREDEISSRFIFVFALSQFRGPDYIWERVSLLPNSVCGCEGLRARLAIALKKQLQNLCRS